MEGKGERERALLQPLVSTHVNHSAARERERKRETARRTDREGRERRTGRQTGRGSVERRREGSRLKENNKGGGGGGSHARDLHVGTLRIYF